MSGPALIFLLVLVAMVSLLVWDRARPGLVVTGAVLVLFLLGVAPAGVVLSGFENPAVWTIGALFLVVQGLVAAGLLHPVERLLLKTGGVRGASPPYTRLLAPVTALSAFINNTPVVMLMIPSVQRWGRSHGIPSSRLLLPLSYASLWGGLWTLTGTSTHLVILGLLMAEGLPGLSFFPFLPMAALLTLSGYLYLVLWGKNRLPSHPEPWADIDEKPLDYLMEARIGARSDLIGKTLQEAGLRRLDGLYLLSIEREGHLLGVINPQQLLEEGDRLIFVGDTRRLETWIRREDLEWGGREDVLRELGLLRPHLVEVVVSERFPGLGRSIRDFSFRAVYRASVVAIHRRGVLLRQKVGDVRLQAGDHLLLLANPNFHKRWKGSQDFYMVETGDKALPQTAGEEGFSLPLVLGLTGSGVMAWLLSHFLPAFPRGGGLLAFTVLAALVMMVAGVLDHRRYTRAIPWDVMLCIASGIGLARTFAHTGLGDCMAEGILSLGKDWGPTRFLFMLLGLTMLLTEVMSNTAAATLMFPLALAMGRHLGLDPRPFILGITLAASLSYLSPVGYQTHLLVQGPGSYAFRDYLRLGWPLSLLHLLLLGLGIPLFWPFQAV